MNGIKLILFITHTFDSQKEIISGTLMQSS